MTVDQVAELLGGTKILRMKVSGPLAMADVTARGFPSESFDRIKEALKLSDAEVAETLGVSSKTVARLRKAPEKLLSPTASDRLYRMARLYLLAAEVLEGEDSARQWLTSPQVGLANRVPLELMGTEAGSREVEALLLRIDYGVIS